MKSMQRQDADDIYAFSRTEQILRKITRNLKAIFGFVVIATVIFAAIFSPFIAPHDPYTQSLEARLLPPFWAEGGSTKHLLGTDHLGRDALSRLIYGFHPGDPLCPVLRSPVYYLSFLPGM